MGDGDGSTQSGVVSTERLDRLPTPVPVAKPQRRPSSPPTRTTSRPTGGQVTSGEITQQARDFTGSLTSHGELCTDTCEKRGYPYFWCHKESSNLGQWWDSDFCSPLPTVTQYGKECSNACEQRGEVYFWCKRLTAVGDIVPLIPSIKKGNVNKAMVTMLSLETVKDMFLAATVGQSSSNVNQLSSLTSSFSLAHSRKMLGVSGCRMNCNKYMFK